MAAAHTDGKHGLGLWKKQAASLITQMYILLDAPILSVENQASHQYNLLVLQYYFLDVWNVRETNM